MINEALIQEALAWQRDPRNRSANPGEAMAALDDADDLIMRLAHELEAIDAWDDKFFAGECCCYCHFRPPQEEP